MVAYADSPTEKMPHLAMVSGIPNPDEPTLVRIHSECLTGDVFGSKRCDCGKQLQGALHQIHEQGGVLVYLRQEGRGIGLINKMKAYQLQDRGLDTFQANMHLGFEADARTYEDALFILQDLGIQQIRLLTNNPEKLQAFDGSDIEVVERVPLIISPEAENEFYLRAKQDIMGHMLSL